MPQSQKFDEAGNQINGEEEDHESLESGNLNFRTTKGGN